MGKTIVVTGGARGIGAATAILAGRRGWSVAFNYRGADAAARKTADAVEAAGGRVLAVKGDVADEQDVVALFDRAIETFGPIDGVVNNAGIIGIGMAFADKPTDQMRRLVDVNVFGALLVEREAATPLPERSAARVSTSKGAPSGIGGATMSTSVARVIGVPPSWPSLTSRAVSFVPIIPAAPTINTCIPCPLPRIQVADLRVSFASWPTCYRDRPRPARARLKVSLR